MDGAAAAATDQAGELASVFPFGGDQWPMADRALATESLLRDLASCPKTWSVQSNGKWAWLAGLKDLAFDSGVFGRRMARLGPIMHRAKWPGEPVAAHGEDVLRAACDHAAARGYDCLVARVPCRDYLAAQCLEACGFRLADVSVEWLLNLERAPGLQYLDEGYSVGDPEDGDAPVLCRLAAESLCDLDAYSDRFALDPGMRGGCPEMYSRWMANCLSGDQADTVLVLRGPKGPAGFICLRRATGRGPGADCGWIVLNAVSNGQRGRGMYNALLSSGMGWLAANGCRRARVRTKVSQQAVIRAWSRLGARQVYADLTFHLWV